MAENKVAPFFPDTVYNGRLLMVGRNMLRSAQRYLCFVED